MNKILILIGLLIAGGVLLLPSVKFAGQLTSGCTGAWTNTSSTVNTTSTTIVSGATFGCPVRVQNNSVNNIFCYLEASTAPSSTIQANAGLKLGAVSTTITGPQVVEFGPDAGQITARRADNLNCIAGAASAVIIQKK